MQLINSAYQRLASQKGFRDLIDEKRNVFHCLAQLRFRSWIQPSRLDEIGRRDAAVRIRELLAQNDLEDRFLRGKNRLGRVAIEVASLR
jgi:hypothetical protein